MLPGNDIVPTNTFRHDLVTLGLALVAAELLLIHHLVVRVQQKKQAHCVDRGKFASSSLITEP